MRRAVLASMLSAGLLAGWGAPVANGAGGCAGVHVDGGWRTISTPAAAVAFTVAPDGRIFAAADRTVAASADGGCTWRQALQLDDVAGGLPVQDRVTAATVVGEAVVVAVTGPYVLVSTDGGASWERHAIGLDVPGDPIGLYAVRSGSVVYMVVRRQVTDQILETAGVGEQGVRASAAIVYRSGDAGRTWERGTEVGTEYTGPRGSGFDGVSSPGALWDLAVDPADPDHLLAAALDGVYRSVDGGRTWSAALLDVGAPVRAVAVRRTDEGGIAAVAVDPGSGTLYETSDPSGAWTARPYPQLRTQLMTTYPNAAAWAWASADGDGFVLSGPKGVFRLEDGELVDVTPPGMSGPAATASDLQSLGDDLWARRFDGSALVVEDAGAASATSEDASAPRAGPGTGADASPDVSAPVARVAPERAVLEGETGHVALAPGEARTVSYEARLGPRSADVDLYFLVDTTSSMSDTVRGLVTGMEEIVVRLARSGVRLRAGVGAFRTYPRETSRVDYAYRRLRALGPADEELVSSLYELEGGGSSGSNLSAVYQAVTGAGQDVLPPGPSKADVAAGGGAGFRDGALKVVMHFADTWFGTPERGDPNGHWAPGTWPGPSFETVSSTLRDSGVLHLGVALQPGEGGTVFADADVVDDMRALSRATSSTAGARGADCDGDGAADVAPGRPLVCVLRPGAGAGGVASVVAGLVEALEDRGDVLLAETGDSGLVRAVSPEVHPAVDLRAPQRLAFEVTVACALRDAGTRRTVDLELLVDGRPAATSGLDVSCADLSAAPPPPVPAPPALSLVPPIPAPPPPHPVPGPGTGSVTAPAPVQAPAPAQAPGGQPNAATVAQRQQQPQAALAAATVQVREQTRMQHALVRTRGRNPLEEARLWTAVGGLTMLWAWGIAAASVASVRRARI